MEQVHVFALGAYPKKDFNEPFDGIVYSVMVSMGFATTENILYAMKGGLEVALLRMVMSVPAHATFAVLMGYLLDCPNSEEIKGCCGCTG